MTIGRDNWTVTWGDASVTSTIGVIFLVTRVRSDIENRWAIWMISRSSQLQVENYYKKVSHISSESATILLIYRLKIISGIVSFQYRPIDAKWRIFSRGRQFNAIPRCTPSGKRWVDLYRLCVLKDWTRRELFLHTLIEKRLWNYTTRSCVKFMICNCMGVFTKINVQKNIDFLWNTDNCLHN